MDERGAYALIEAITKQAADDYRAALLLRHNRHAATIKQQTLQNNLIAAAYSNDVLTYIFEKIHKEVYSNGKI